MKPLKITMTAFGPYKNQEAIDFSELDEHRLFVISGNTGAGKTTIFDAICFALYGEASGEERNDTQLLRSHFAADETQTSVELDFELHGRTYRVFRQLAHVKDGNKTATGAAYELYETTSGEAVPCVDRFNVTDINHKIEQILGLSKDQFSQIVMLPQGEFRKLLTSETENKEDILRRIFKTGLYRGLAERLKDKRKEAAQRYEQRARERDFHIQNIKAVLPERDEASLFQILSQEHYNTIQIAEALEEEAAHYANETEQNKKKQAESAKAYQEKIAAYHRAGALNEKFQSLDDKRERKAKLEAEVPKIKEKERKLESAERASHLEVYEQHQKEMNREARAKKQEMESSAEKKRHTEESLAVAQTAYEKEEADHVKREKVSLELNRLNDFLPTVRDLDEKKAKLTKLETSQTQLQQELQRFEAERGTDKQQKQLLEEKVKRAEEAVMELPKKQEKLIELRDRWKVLNDFIDVQKMIAAGDNDMKVKYQESETAQKAYDQAEQRWLEGQAGQIAGHLHDGMPCPVCGSTQHPKKAQGHENLPGKTELDRLRKAKAEKEQVYLQAQANREALHKQLSEKEIDVREYGFQGQDFTGQLDQLEKQGKILKKETEALKQSQETLKKLKQNHVTLEKEMEGKAEKVDKLKNELHETRTAFQTQKALYDQSLQPIPEELRSLERLEQRLQEMQGVKQRLEQQWKDVQERLQQAKERAATAKANVANAEKQQLEASEKAKKALGEFQEALKRAGFADEEAYKQAKMGETYRAELKKTIEVFYTDRSNLASQIQELEKELETRSRVDLETLSAEVKKLEADLEAARKALQESETYQKESVKLRQNITIAAEKVKEEEKDLQMVTDLYDVVRGDNARKISFERYLQIEFLEQIIQSANERLKRLSNGQFYLMRSERLEKRGKQSGLGLDVYDAYTGQTRDVKSLSGGEKFNASLCLALGMTDVIQAFEGGISIETMFIDEGFGSLDEESLNKAIDTLIDLQKSGRMVGVISHVQELKNAIPAVLDVQKTKEGHSRTQFLLK
ncbi:MAG TPA: SMC family ATPase [Bacillales bacterium]|nr:SMC family ATPase [Bacillales bacterium]